jgi:hypothetical protein
MRDAEPFREGTREEGLLAIFRDGDDIGTIRGLRANHAQKL